MWFYYLQTELFKANMQLIRVLLKMEDLENQEQVSLCSPSVGNELYLMKPMELRIRLQLFQRHVAYFVLKVVGVSQEVSSLCYDNIIFI